MCNLFCERDTRDLKLNLEFWQNRPRLMVNSLYIGLSQQMALRHQMDGVANNIANVNTTGFKRDQILFREFLVPAEEGGETVNYSYVLDFGTSVDMSNGELTPTGNPFDLALQGNGFFTVETEAGNRYTRNGHFSTDAEGTLVTSDGDPVLDSGGAYITFAPEDGAITISSDGTISAEFSELGGTQIGLVTFANLTGLKKEGGGLFNTDQVPTGAPEATVQQGMIENSNVNAVVEMTRMIDVSRKYQTTQRMIDAGFDLERSAIQRLGEVR
jgi:flagellar basal-body rod protein FlgF